MASPNSRRRFLKGSFGTAVAAGLAESGQSAAGDDPASQNSATAAPQVQWRNRNEAMRYRMLGRTGMMVSEIVMGGNEITPDNYQHVFEAMDMGLNYLDTSPAYGKGASELGFAKVIKQRPRDHFFLTSKVSVWDLNRNERFEKIYNGLSGDEQSRLRGAANDLITQRGAAEPDYLGDYFGSQTRELNAAALSDVMQTTYGDRIDRDKNYRQIIIDSVEGSLQRLGTDHLDVLMCPHGASSPVELTRYPEIFDAFNELKVDGKVRFLGVSSHNDPAGVLDAATKSGIYSVAMVAYNVVNESFMNQAIDAAHDAGVGVIAMKVARPVYRSPQSANGNREGRKRLNEAVDGDWSIPQKAYLWALRNPKLSAVISNMVNAEQVAENIILPLHRG
ncbi:aldo/keto reductase [Crateriforma conspicua]|uniref:2,5-diketo-D-gluconate reductase B n=1 Tax=Crateriforma conspicua TaxID=2527996 RepID=A0A5C5Y2B5_9PLAN|nr:aldo/keto reductase [Crateriforma conspicua]TWT68793.1 2,5-diketo-D-gluconate reductase B [Crateriforma conspicua]